MANPFDYIAIISREQASNSLYLKSFSQALRNQKQLRGILIHADNERTENLIQDGVMREQARKRVTRETTKRLVDMFAEAGVAAVGMQGWQLLGIENGNDVVLKIDPREKIPTRTHLVFSNQMREDGSEMEIENLAVQLARILSIRTVVRFRQSAGEGIFVQQTDLSRKSTIALDEARSHEPPVIQDWDLSEWSNAESILAS